MPPNKTKQPVDVPPPDTVVKVPPCFISTPPSFYSCLDPRHTLETDQPTKPMPASHDPRHTLEILLKTDSYPPFNENPLSLHDTDPGALPLPEEADTLKDPIPLAMETRERVNGAINPLQRLQEELSATFPGYAIKAVENFLVLMSPHSSINIPLPYHTPDASGYVMIEKDGVLVAALSIGVQEKTPEMIDRISQAIQS